MMALGKIIFIYFLIGFISDVALNYLSRQSYVPKAIKALEIYFKRKTIKSAFLRDFISAINAGLTIVGALCVTMLISKMLLGFIHPKTVHELWRFVLIAFCVGYLTDVIIYKVQLFGATLDPFYKIAGAGLWGALAFIFSIVVGYAYLHFIK
jgi:hypothetical protein